ncbi:MAG: hypothetical protein KBF48_11275 [Xanthomonadales bacterium]|nr:hypothetical protein [Xanthomonadales bacterium]
MLENLRYAIDGARDGMAWREDREARAAATQRQAALDAQAQERYGMQLAEHQADRAQADSDRAEFELPEKRARAAATTRQEKERVGREKAAAAYEALLRGDTKPTEDFYTNDVPDGHDVKLQFLPDGTIQMQHPNGTAVAKNADELWFGKEDGTGLGLYQVAFPDQAIETVKAGRKERKDRETKLEDEERSNAQRMREIAAGRAPMPQYGMDAAGNTVLINGARAQSVMGPDGKPLQGATIAGRGGRFGGASANPFGNSAEMQRLWRGVQMARAADPTGRLTGMPDDAVAGMVNEIAQAGESRDARMKMATQLVRQAASGTGEFSTPEEIQARAESLVGVVDTLAGPAPTMYGIGTNAVGEPMPSGENNDPMGIR